LFLVFCALCLLLSQAVSGGRPKVYYNIYRNTPKVELLRPEIRKLAPEESDLQHLTVALPGHGFTLQGSVFFLSRRTTISNVPPSGLIKRVFPKMKSVLRIYAAFSRRAQNYLELRFNRPILLPRWTESVEFWSLEYGARRGYRMVYRDAGGREHFIQFKMRRIRGWVRYAANIPIRQAENRPFSYRYQELHLTRLILLDDFAGRRRQSIYHLANICASRKVITSNNSEEFWKFRKFFRFNSNTVSSLRIHSEGLTNFRTRVITASNNSGPKQFLRISAELRDFGGSRIRIRFPAPVRVAVCRKLLITFRSATRNERILFLVGNDLKKYYLIDFRFATFDRWRKLEASVPALITQSSRYTTRLKGLLVHGLLILPRRKRGSDRVAFDIGWVGAVYDRDIFFPGRRGLLKFW